PRPNSNGKTKRQSKRPRVTRRNCWGAASDALSHVRLPLRPPLMDVRYSAHVRELLEQLRADGFEKKERVIGSPQAPEIELEGGQRVVNFCANNYLGLANDPRLASAAQEGLARYGFGLASVRFICGTQSVHKALEAALAAFLKTDAAILYGSCFDANGGLFETLLTEEDAV